MGWWSNPQDIKSAEQIEEVNAAFPTIEKFGENLTPNLRALRLAMTASDVLLSFQQTASSRKRSISQKPIASDRYTSISMPMSSCCRNCVVSIRNR